jgi:Icc-related predicted phosphoesterase
MIVCFTTDLHGRTNLYQQSAELVHRTNADLLVFGGDMLPDGEMRDPRPGQTEFVRTWLADWLGQLHRERRECQVATIFGNHDWVCSIQAVEQLESDGLLTVLRPDRVAEFGGWKLLGYSCSPPSPFLAKDLERLDRPGDRPPVAGGGRWDSASGTVVKAPAPQCFTSVPSIQEDLATIPTVDGRWIFVSHAGPYESNLDRLITGQPVGSRSVREFIEQRKPEISLHGHLHDSPYVSGHFYERIGNTVSINPGQGTETLAAVTFDSEDLLGTLTGHGIRLPSMD